MEMNEFELSTSGNKAIAREIVNKKDVDKKSLYTIAYILPVWIISGILMGISVFMKNDVVALILGIILGIIVSAFTLSFIIKIHSAMFTGRAKFGLVFDKDKWMPIVLITVIMDGINLLTIVMGTGIIKALLGLVTFILGVICIMVYYVAVAREYRGMEAFTIGIKLGFKYFFRLLLLMLSFIPLSLLIGITFGIVGIWKGMYIQTTYCVLCEKILRREGYTETSNLKENIEF